MAGLRTKLGHCFKKINQQQCNEIIRLRESGMFQKEIAERFGISPFCTWRDKRIR